MEPTLTSSASPSVFAKGGIALLSIIVIGGAFGVYAYTVNTQVKVIEQAMTTSTEPILVVVPPVAPIEQPKPMSTKTTLRFVGDIMLDRNVSARTKTSGDPLYPFAKLPPGWLGEADITVGNLEGPITAQKRAPEKSIDFAFDPSWVKRLFTQGLDAFSQANNHTLDQGRIGANESRKYLSEGGFIVFGDQVNDDEIALATTTVNGVKFAFLGWNSTDNPIAKEDALKAIQAASSSDIRIAYLHWGNEYKAKPDQSSIDMAHWLIDNGVDVVIGGHPHWAQGFGMYKNKPIIWSLGNFIFDQDWSTETQQGLAASIELTEKNVSAIDIHPLSIIKSQPALLLDRQKTERLDELAERSDAELADQVRSGRIELK